MRSPFTVITATIAMFVGGYLVSRSSFVFSGATPMRGARMMTTSDKGASEVTRLSVGEFLTLCEQPASLKRDHDLFAALQKMSAVDFLKAVTDLPSLVARVDKLKKPLRGQVIEAAMKRWLEADPNGALTWLGSFQALASKIPAFEGKQPEWASVGKLFPVIAAKNPEWLKEHLDSLTDKEGRRLAIEALLEEGAKANTGRAREWLAGFRDAADKKAATDGILRGLAESNPKLGMDIALKASKEEGRDTFVFNIVSQSAIHHPQLVSELLGQIEDAGQRVRTAWMSSCALSQNTASDPIAFLEQNLSKKELETIGVTTNSLWWLVDRESERAADWAVKLEGKKREVLTGILWPWCQGDPKAAMAWVSKCPVESLPPASTTWDYALGELATREPLAFESWLSHLPEGDLRDRSQVVLARRFAYEGNLPEASRIFQQAATNPATEKIARQFAETLASQDVAFCPGWVSSLPSGPAQNSAAEGVASIWVRQDSQALAAWIEALPPGLMRDAATGRMTESLADGGPSAASQWVETIRDSSTRSKAANNVFYAWFREDPPAAVKWMQGLEGIDVATKARLLSNKR